MLLLLAISGHDAMSKQFQPGDKVRHKSGGPVMAVEGYDVRGRVICCLWDKVPIQRCLTEALLERVTPAAPEPRARFRPGDRVRLISGSPHMLVEGYDIAGRVICK
jgi:uncharacterized protein YodC (DUF2158 family)